jgi:LysM repeat protein
MTKHEKNERAAVRKDGNIPTNTADEEPLDDLEGAEELLKTSFTAGKEMKIAVAVIGVLVLIFAAVVVRWLWRSSGAAPTSAEPAVATNDRPETTKRDKNQPEPDRREISPFGPTAKMTKTTAVPAVPGSGSELKPKFGIKGPDNWSFASDAKSKAPATEDRSSPPASSFQARIASRDASVSATHPKKSDEPKPSFGGWQQDLDDRSRPASSPPSDPFRNRLARETPQGLVSDTSSRSPAASQSGPLSDPKAPRATETPRWGQNPASPGDRTSAGRGEEPNWVMPPSNFGSPSGSSAMPNLGSSPGPNPLRSSSPAGAAVSSPSPAPSPLSALPPSSGASVRPPDPSPSTLNPPTARTNPPEALAPSGGSLPKSGRRTYIVKNGDTLYDIARQQLGKASRWREIYELNKDLINTRWLDLEPGTQLLLPDAASESLTERPGVGSLR